MAGVFFYQGSAAAYKPLGNKSFTLLKINWKFTPDTLITSRYFSVAEEKLFDKRLGLPSVLKPIDVLWPSAPLG